MGLGSALASILNSKGNNTEKFFFTQTALYYPFLHCHLNYFFTESTPLHVCIVSSNYVVCISESVVLTWNDNYDVISRL